MNYRREIDGLRAIALIPVVLFHAGYKWFAGGFVGVDVFFVISGYLITSLIVAEREKGTFSLVHFYERRARRILPPLLCVMLACVPFAWLWMMPDQLTDWSKSLVWTSLFISNIYFGTDTSYFAADAEEKPLLHTWSLAVEETILPGVAFADPQLGLREEVVCGDVGSHRVGELDLRRMASSWWS